MNLNTKNKSTALGLLERLAKSRPKKLPESFLKAAGVIKNKAQRRSLERHVKQIRSEWR